MEENSIKIADYILDCMKKKHPESIDRVHMFSSSAFILKSEKAEEYRPIQKAWSYLIFNELIENIPKWKSLSHYRVTDKGIISRTVKEIIQEDSAKQELINSQLSQSELKINEIQKKIKNYWFIQFLAIIGGIAGIASAIYYFRQIISGN